MRKKIQDVKKIKRICLENAEGLLSLSERELGKGIDHICFHLALLALEEVGKSILITIDFTISESGREKENRINKAMDDHVKKIFWALWGIAFKKTTFTKKEIEKITGLATSLHEQRLLSLYTDPENPIDPKKRAGAFSAPNLIQLTRSRLEMEKLSKLKDKISLKDVEELNWFHKSSEDSDKRIFIFGHESIAKLEEFQNIKKWIRWLMDHFNKIEEEMRKMTELEMKREKPSEKEAFKAKYRVRVRIQSQSHSIKNKAFQKWNERIERIKIYKSDRKDNRSYVKSEMIIDFTFPKAIPIHLLWEHSFFEIKMFVIALNIATRGIFWWNIQKDIDSFFEEVTDLEASTDGSIKIGLAFSKKLTLNWDEARLSLTERDMSIVSTVFAFLMNEFKKIDTVLKPYALGMITFGKTDIHLRMEPNAFEQFFITFKNALIIFGDWDGKSNLYNAAKKQFSQIADFKELKKTIQLGIDYNPEKEQRTSITLTEVVSMKLYCDVYIQMKSEEFFKARKAIKSEATDKV